MARLGLLWIQITGFIWIFWVVLSALLSGSFIVMLGTLLGVGSLWVTLGYVPGAVFTMFAIKE